MKQIVFMVILILFSALFSCKKSMRLLTGENALAGEKSPYLKRHASNPINWQPWSEEVFIKAKKENKLVYLSIGYLTCHWCNVMEEESYSSEAVAEVINKIFIPVKVDREELPDVDSFYMNACSILSDTGCGWPLNVILTPERLPVFASTYMPPHTLNGRMGLVDAANLVEDIWKTNPEKINEITSYFKSTVHAEQKHTGIASPEAVIQKIFHKLSKKENLKTGGFSDTSGFPMPSRLRLYLTHATNTNSSLSHLNFTLEKMFAGALYDHIGHGFHRYTIDPGWIRPHFEKMLYDQALLSAVYMDAFKMTGDPLFKKISLETIDFTLREMREGRGFIAALDAIGKDGEGSVYLWDEDEINKNLSSEELSFFSQYFLLREISLGDRKGNPDLDRVRVVLRKKRPEFLKAGSSPEDLAAKKLLKYRNNREKAKTDRMMPLDWNAMMVSTLAKAGAFYGRQDYILQSEETVNFLTDVMADEKHMYHSYITGHGVGTANLSDHAHLVQALLDVYEATFKIKYLKLAVKYTDRMLKEFYDKDRNDLYDAASDSEVPMRTSRWNEDEIPSGASVAIMDLQRISMITAGKKYTALLEQLFETALSKSNFYGGSASGLLDAVYRKSNPGYEIVIAGKRDSADTKQLLEEIRRNYLPGSVILLNDDPSLSDISPYTADQKMREGKAVAYLCRNYICNLPVKDAAGIKKILKKNERK